MRQTFQQEDGDHVRYSAAPPQEAGASGQSSLTGEEVTQQEAAQALTPLDEQIAELELAIKNRSKFSPRTVPSSLVAVALFAVLIKNIALPEYRGTPLFFGVLAAIISSYLLAASGALGGLVRLRKAAQALAGSDAPAAVGVMLSLLHGNESANSIAGSALIRMLPHLCDDGAPTLTDSQRESLRSGLRNACNRRKFFRYNPALAIVMIRTIEHFGVTADIDLLLEISRKKPGADEEVAIHEAAIRCLSVLTRGAEIEPHTLGSIPTAPASLLPAELDSISLKIQDVARLRKRSAALTILGCLGGTAFAIARMAEFRAHSDPNPLLMFGMLGSGALIGSFAARGVYRQRNLTNALMSTDDLKVINPLLQLAASAEISGATAATVLTPLLKRMRATDEAILDDAARDKLHWALYNHYANREFVLAALQALEQVGDGRSVAAVQRVYDRAPRGKDGQIIRDTAQECLQALKLRAAADEANQTLLRASSASAEPPNALLRSAEEPPETGQEELLRVSSELILA